MKNGRIANIIVLYYVLITVYELLYPTYESSEKPWYYTALYCYYYLLSYGILFAVSLGYFKKSNYKADSLALFTLVIYSAGKFVYFIFLINKDFPTYVSALNSKTASITISILLWSGAVIIWVKKFNINKLLR